MFSIKYLVKSIFLLLGLAGIFLWIYLLPLEKNSQAKKSSEEQKQYFGVAQTILSPADLPWIETTIEGEKYVLLLDLGFTGELSLLNKHLPKIDSKQHLGTSLSYNLKGEAQTCQVYRISKASTRAASWYNPTVKIYDDTFFERTKLYSKSASASNIPHCDGLLGWKLFTSLNLLLDLGNDKTIVCDSTDTLREHGYLVDNWVKTPLLLDRGLVEFEVITPDGLMRCSLDTGTTVNVLSKELMGTSIAQACVDSSTYVEFPFFKVNGVDLGPITFCQFPINLPIPVPLTLGMWFFLDHQVFLDFKNGFVYFSTSPCNSTDNEPDQEASHSPEWSHCQFKKKLDST